LSEPVARPRSFAALGHAGYGGFVAATAVTMLADNTEHVISYWMLFQRFHSPALGAFAVISHWVPFLLLAGVTGQLADRIAPRHLIRAGMLVFMAVSGAWGWLFYSDTLQEWHAWVLLSLHGLAGVLWSAPSQLLIHELVGREHLQSAVRLSASARYLGTLVGPALGNLLLVLLGPSVGMWANVLIYLPMVLWLSRPRGATQEQRVAVRAEQAAHAAQAALAGERRAGLASTWQALRAQPPILAMLLLAAGAALCVGTAYQAQMPGFAADLGSTRAGGAYAALLAADAAGALLAVLVLESRGLLAPAPRTALLLAACWCLAVGGFALSGHYWLALPLLCAAGFFELSFNSMAQTLVQLNAPPAQRGRIIGLYVTGSLGLRTFSGITVGLGALLVGIHYSLALSSLLLLGWVGLLAAGLRRSRSSPAGTAPAP
jgi:MFS family permease